MTHNLAAMDFESAPPRWASEFDAWAAEAIAAAARSTRSSTGGKKRRPSTSRTRTTGGTFASCSSLSASRSESGGAARVTFPVTGFEATMSKRSVQLA